jgi:hypothetical protein
MRFVETSGLTLIPDLRQTSRHVRKVPMSDIAGLA